MRPRRETILRQTIEEDGARCSTSVAESSAIDILCLLRSSISMGRNVSGVLRRTPCVLINSKCLAGAATFMAIAISGPIEAQPPDGFEGAHWGMSIQQIQSVFGGRLIPFTPPGGDASSAKFGFPDYDIDGCKLDIDFKFENEHLARVDLVLISTLPEVAEYPTKIAESLTAKYGSPAVGEPSNEMHSQGHERVWMAGETKISQYSFFFQLLIGRLCTSIRNYHIWLDRCV